jgi:hypothetical protein
MARKTLNDAVEIEIVYPVIDAQNPYVTGLNTLLPDFLTGQ